MVAAKDEETLVCPQLCASLPQGPLFELGSLELVRVAVRDRRLQARCELRVGISNERHVLAPCLRVRSNGLGLSVPFLFLPVAVLESRWEQRPRTFAWQQSVFDDRAAATASCALCSVPCSPIWRFHLAESNTSFPNALQPGPDYDSKLTFMSIGTTQMQHSVPSIVPRFTEPTSSKLVDESFNVLQIRFIAVSCTQQQFFNLF